MGQKPLDSYTIRRINYLKHEGQLKQTAIARALNISRTAVRKYLLPPTEWIEFKTKNSLEK